MKKESMEVFFKPASVAVIGATERGNSVGRALCLNLLESERQNKKLKVYFVNPHRETVFKRRCYRDILEIKNRVELCVIAVSRDRVKDVARQCAQKQGVRGTIVISAGFAEVGKSGQILQDDVVSIFQEKNILMLGPNCLGIVSPVSKFNASFSPLTPQKGDVAIVSQSGALLDTIMKILGTRGVGFSRLVSYGNGAMLGVEDFLKYLSQDKATKAIMIYLEGLKKGREFVDSLKKASLQKRIVVLKGGKTKKGEKAALSHTGSLATESRLFSLAFKEGGAFEARTFEEFLFLGRFLSRICCFPRKNSKVGVITNAGAIGVLISDIFSQKEIPLEKNSPLDVRGDATSDVFVEATRFVLEEENVGSVIVAITPQAMTDFEEIARGLSKLSKKYSPKIILPILLGSDNDNQKAEKIFSAKQIVALKNIQEATWAEEALNFYSGFVK